ncbi:MAG: formylglycine-generating enzyme family protein [Treponema sp.]|nr:formylglycine-generating enzyme family protein [Treponema sp.]
MKKNKRIVMLLALLLAVSTTSVMAKGLLEGFSSDSSSKNAEMPDPRIGRMSRPPTPRASGNTFTNSVGMRFTLVQPGTVIMNGTDPANAAAMKTYGKEYQKGGDPVEYPTSITRPFYIGITTVTERQWQAVMGRPANDYPTNAPGYHDRNGYAPGTRSGPDGPANPINWNEAQEFINCLNEKEGTNRYRLATEAEWMRAIRGNYGLQYPIVEWCNDAFDDKYFPRMPSADPWGPAEGSYKVTRAGWNLITVNAGVDRFFSRKEERRDHRPQIGNETHYGFRVVLDTDHPGEVPAKPLRQFTVEARSTAVFEYGMIAGSDPAIWGHPPVMVKINDGPEQVVVSSGRSPIKRTFTAAIGDKVEVRWLGDDRTGKVHVYYTDTPAANINDSAKILVVSGGGIYDTPIHGRFAVTARGTPNSIIFGTQAARQVTTAPGTFTVEIIALNSSLKSESWGPSHGSVLISVNGGLPTPLVEQLVFNDKWIPTPHKVTFNARAGDRVQIIWRAGSSAGMAQVFVYRNDRPARDIKDTANILSAIGWDQAVRTERGAENVVVDMVIR